MPFDGIGFATPQSPTMTVVLHGRLARKFGARHEIGVRTAAEAIYFLCRMHKGFVEEFEPGTYQVIRGTVRRGLPLSEGMLNIGIGNAGELHIVPVARGAKSGGGTAKMIIGAVILVAVVVATAGAGAALTAPVIAGMTGTFAVTWGGLALFGAAILLGGISQAISSQPKNNAATQVDPKASFGLAGPTNTVGQGSPIPVIYGRTRVGSVAASFGYSAEDYLAPADGQGSNPVGSTLSAIGAQLATGAGGGGKGGGGGGGASEAPNTLRSNAVVRIIDILGEGPIGGLVDGAKSIYFNGTPLMASDGTYNFQGVTWEVRLGLPDQDPVPGYPAAEQTRQVGVQVKKLTPALQTITSATANAVKVTIRLPALTTQNTKNGNLEAGPDLNYRFDVRKVGGLWSQAVAVNLSGQKCTSPYQRTHRIELPDVGSATSWEIRMTRLSDDSTTTNVQSDTYWDSLTVVTDHALTYPGTAYVALTIDAAAFGSQIPTRSYEIDGLLVRVPANYDSINGVYATSGPGTSMGTWDGASWALTSTSNPCWCYLDMLENRRYGLGLPSAALTITAIDLFIISQYADARVPTGFKDDDGNDTVERRYSLNVAMTTQEDAYRVLTSMVSSFRGLTYWGAGCVATVADMPTVTSSVLNSANVLDGEFTYEGTSLKSRHTVARVAWLDPANAYQPSIEVVEDFDQVVTLGQVVTEVHAFGCTSRGLAHRLGKWLLDTEKTQNETLTVRCGPEQLRVRPGDVVTVADPNYMGIRLAGRCAAGSTTTKVNLDGNFPANGELQYWFTVTMPDGTVATRLQVAGIGTDGGSNGGRNVVVLALALPMAPMPDATWVLSAEGAPGPHGPEGVFPVSPREFKILSVAEVQRGVFSLLAVNHDKNKYARVEYGLKFDPTPYSTLNQLLVAPIPPPSNVFADDYMMGVGTTNLIRCTVSFTPVVDPRVTATEVRIVGPEVRSTSSTGNSADFDNLQLGAYVPGARSIGRDGRASVWVDGDPVVVDGLADPPPVVLGLTAQGGTLAVALNWRNSTARDILHYEVWRAPAPQNGTHPFPTTAFQPTGAPAANGATLLATVAATMFVDSGDLLGPDKGWAYWVRPVNTTLVAGGFAGPVRAVTTYLLTDNLEQSIRNTAPIAQALLGSAPTNVADLNTPGTIDGQLVVLTTNGSQTLYRWDSASRTWKRYVAIIPDSLGKLTDAQIASIDAAKVTGSFSTTQANQVALALGNNVITSDKIGGLAGSKVSGTLTNAAVPLGKLFDVDAQGNAVQGADVGKLLTGLRASQIVDVDPTTGNAIVGKIAAARLAGTVDVAQIPAVPTTKLTGDLLAAVSASLNLASAKVSGILSNLNIPGLQALTGKVAYGQVDAGAVDAAALRAGSVTTSALAVGSANNQIANSCFFASAEGWTGNMTITPVLGTGWAAGFNLLGAGAAILQSTAAAAGEARDIYYTAGKAGTGRNYDASIPAAVGETWEAQIAYAASYGSAQIFLLFVDASGASTSTPASDVANFPGTATAQSLADWHTLAVRGTAPAGTVAVGLLVRLRNAGSTSQPLVAFVTRALLGKTVPNAASLLPWTPGGLTSVTGGLLQNDTILARHMTANSVRTAALDAGAITAEKLAIGSSTNVISNCSCILSTDNWQFLGNIPVESGYSLPSYTVVGEGTGFVKGTGTLAVGQNIVAFYSPNPTGYGVPCEPGTWVEAQIQGASHRCAFTLQIQFYTAAGVALTSASIGSARYSGYGGGSSLTGYVKAFCKGQVPATAAFMRLTIFGFRDATNDYAAGDASTAGVNPYVFFCRAALGVSTPVPMALSTPQPFAPGGITTITGGMLASDTIVGRHILAGTISAEKLTVGTSANVVWNSCCTGSTDGWTVGNDSSGTGRLSAAAKGTSSYLTGFGTGVLGSSALVNGAGFVDANWWPNPPYKGIAVQGGSMWEAQARIMSAGCTGQIVIDWYDGANTLVGQSLGPDTGGPNDQGTGARILSNYALLGFVAKAPATAVFASLNIRLKNGVTAGAFLLFTQTMLAPTVPNATQISTWSAGGGIEMSGGAITSNSVFARVLAANQIGARELNIGNSANVIPNSSFAVTAEGWASSPQGGATAGTLQSCATAYTDHATPDGAGVITTNFPGAGAYVDLSTAFFACTSGETLEAQAMVLPVAAQAKIYLVFVDKAGGFVAYSNFSNVAPSQGVPSTAARGTLASFTPITLIWAVPANAVQVCMVIRTECPQPGAAIGYTVITRTGLGRTVPGATQVSAWAPGGNTSISGGIVRSEALVARHFTVGAVQAEHIAVANATNVIFNPGCPVSSYGWRLISNAPGGQLGSVTGDGLAPSGYALSGEGCGVVRATSMSTAQVMAAAWDPDFNGGVPCSPGEWWEAQALIGAHRCYAFVQLMFSGPSGDIYGPTGTRVAGILGGTEVANFGFSWLKAQAPAGATRVKLILVANNDGGADISAPAGTTPYLFFTRALLGRSTSVPQALSKPQAFQVGGASSIDGGQMRTGAVTARVVSAGAITAEALSVGSISNTVTNCCANPTAAGWSSGVSTFLPGELYGLDGYGSGRVFLASMSFPSSSDYWWAPQGDLKGDGTNSVPYGAATPCTPGELWEGQALVQTHRCSVDVFLIFTGANPGGGYRIVQSPHTGEQSWAVPASGASISDYTRVSIRGVAPAGANSVTIMFRVSNTDTTKAVHGSSAGVNAYFIFSQVALGRALPNVPIMPWGAGGTSIISGGQLQNASVNTIQLSAAAVKADQIDANVVRGYHVVAGEISTAKLTAGSATNVIHNSTLEETAAGWNFGSSTGLNLAGRVRGTGLDPQWNLQGSGTGVIAPSGKLGIGQNCIACWDPNYNDYGYLGVPVQGGVTYEAQAMVIPSNCAGSVQIQWFDGAGNLIGAATSPRVLSKPGITAGGSLNEYTLAWIKGTAPANAVRARFIVYGSNDGGTGIDQNGGAILFFTHTLFGISNTTGMDKAEPMAWSNGSATSIDGGNVKTGTLDAVKINVNTLTAGSAFILRLKATVVEADTVRAVLVGAKKLTAEQIDVDNLVVGGVKAGAIGADQIAGNQIFGRHLAAEQILTSAAQIGVATIQAANIGDLQVNGEKITPGAVTGAGFATGVFNGTPSSSGWTVISPVAYIEKRAGMSGVVVFLKSLNDFYISYPTSGPQQATGGEGNGL